MSDTPELHPQIDPVITPSAPEPSSSFSPPSRSKRSWLSSGIAPLLVAALVGGLAGHYAGGGSSSGLAINQLNESPSAAVLPNGKSIPSLIKSVLPAIVSIDVKANGSEDQGTGMIITKNGYVVTNNHVIAAAAGGSATITVTASGSTRAIAATLIGTNPVDDVALIKISNVSNEPTVVFGNSNALQVGDAVVAIGNALGLAAGTPTVTTGIVSAMGRTVTAGSATSSETLNNMIQTDAAINPGNSGGPLLDSAGAVVGMDTAVAGTLPDGTSAQNIGFAIPVATIQSQLAALKKGESVVTHHAYLGVEIMDDNASIQQQYGLSVSSGAVILSVVANSPADRFGLKQGDVITAINGTPVSQAADVQSILSLLHAGDEAKVKVARGSSTLTVKVTLGRTP